MDNVVKRVISQNQLPQRISRQSWKGAEHILGEEAAEQDHSVGGFILNLNYYDKVKQRIKLELDNAYSASKFAVLVPTGLFGLSEGFHFPDTDISLLGIKNHRYFLFHSAIGLYVVQHFYRQWLDKQSNPEGWSNRVLQKVTGVLLGSGAIGVGIHLLTDVFQPKSIVFPFFGSLVEGTLIDDNIWLLGNSLWAFKIGRDIFALTISDEYEKACSFVECHLKEGMLEMSKKIKEINL